MTRPSDAELVKLLRRAADRDRAATKEGVARRAEYRAAADALEAAEQQEPSKVTDGDINELVEIFNRYRISERDAQTIRDTVLRAAGVEGA